MVVMVAVFLENGVDRQPRRLPLELLHHVAHRNRANIVALQEMVRSERIRAHFVHHGSGSRRGAKGPGIGLGNSSVQFARSLVLGTPANNAVFRYLLHHLKDTIVRLIQIDGEAFSVVWSGMGTTKRRQGEYPGDKKPGRPSEKSESSSHRHCFRFPGRFYSRFEIIITAITIGR